MHPNGTAERSLFDGVATGNTASFEEEVAHARVDGRTLPTVRTLELELCHLSSGRSATEDKGREPKFYGWFLSDGHRTASSTRLSRSFDCAMARCSVNVEREMLSRSASSLAFASLGCSK